jgi:hypothetical protein
MELRDKRKKNWFWMKNHIIDKYGSKLGPYGLAMYAVLARKVDNETQSTAPSIATLAKLSGMSRRKAVEVLQHLETQGLIEVHHRVSDEGDPTSNLYILTDPKVTHEEHDLVQDMRDGKAGDAGGDVQEMHTYNKTPQCIKTPCIKTTESGFSETDPDGWVTDEASLPLTDSELEGIFPASPTSPNGKQPIQPADALPQPQRKTAKPKPSKVDPRDDIPELVLFKRLRGYYPKKPEDQQWVIDSLRGHTRQSVEPYYKDYGMGWLIDAKKHKPHVAQTAETWEEEMRRGVANGTIREYKPGCYEPVIRR